MSNTDKNKIKRMPYNKTYRQEKRLEELAYEKELKKGRLKNRLIFTGIICVVILSVIGLVYLTTHVSDWIYSLIGVE